MNSFLKYSLVITTISLCACSSHQKNIKSQQISYPSQEDVKKHNESNELELCGKQLSALKKHSPASYNGLNSEFTTLMKKTYDYSAVRNVLPPDQVSSLDSMYEFKSKDLCQKISFALYSSIASLKL